MGKKIAAKKVGGAKRPPAKPKKPAAPDHLTMNLFAPGMSAIHRAGLGGLACTLKAIERHYEEGIISKDALPAPYIGGQPPWEIDDQTVTLKFGEPQTASEYLRKLFEFAFRVRDDGLIILPGQFTNEPSAAILADLQLGLTLTFLQHGKVRQLAKESTIVQYNPEDDGLPGVQVEYRKCSGFKHQEGWKELVDKNGSLISTSIRVDGPVCPGTVVRHVAFTSDTAGEDPPSRMLPLYFALVGCLPLAVNRGVAALIVPEVVDLLEYQYERPAMSPTTPKETIIANAADGVLQAQIRLKSCAAASGTTIPGCFAMTFTPTPWASQQKSRVNTIRVHAASPNELARFERALMHLPLRIVGRKVKEATGKGKAKVVTERTETFRADSVVRPRIAENLALGRPWYRGFVDLMTKKNPANDKPFRDDLSFERKGLNAMINDPQMWDEEGEKLIVQAVHKAMSMRYAQIADENKGNSKAMSNRMERFREKLRLDLAGAKTASHVRFALTDLFSRGGNNSVLREGWERVLPVLRKDWQLARDLGLLALASYAGKGVSDSESTPS
jgi:CRISPR-associated protein Cas8a1/Csx13